MAQTAAQRKRAQRQPHKENEHKEHEKEQDWAMKNIKELKEIK